MFVMGALREVPNLDVNFIEGSKLFGTCSIQYFQLKKHASQGQENIP